MKRISSTVCRVGLVTLLLAALLAMAPGSASGKARKCHRQQRADTVLVNGKIITVDRHDSIAQAVAIKNGRIMAVGRNWEIAKYVGPRTTIVNLRGRTATPGMVDVHTHFSSGTRALYVLDLGPSRVHSIADVAAMVQAQCALVGPGEWVQGFGWGVAYLDEARPIYAADLDPVSPDNPVFLRETSGHQAVANSVALALAGIDENTPDPPGGIIDRDANGKPTGLLKESAANLVSSLIPAFTEDQQIEGLKYMCRQANAAGITAVLDPGIRDATWKVYKRVYGDGALTVRCGVLWRLANDSTTADVQALIDKIKPITHPYNKDNDMLWSQGVKMFCDGVQDASTHWSWKEHYTSYYGEVDPGNYGASVWTDPHLYRKDIIQLHNAGLQVQSHCCGDRAADWTLESFKVALEKKPIRGLRHGVIHWDLPTDWALKTAPKMQKKWDAGYAYTNPVFMWWTEIIANSMGPQMSLREMPLRTFDKIGLLYAFGSDYPVDPIDPKYGIWSAMTRKTLMGIYGEYPFGTDECIGVRSALRAQTSSAAYLLFMENKIGSIEKGKYADIAVWDKDWYSATADEIFNINCELTMLNGEVVYQDDDSPITIITR